MKRRLGPLLGLALLVSCDGESEEGRIELERFAMPVECEENAECVDIDGTTVPPWPLEGWALVTTEASRHAPNGLYVYAEIPLDETRSATLEIDVPLAGDDAELVADVAYVEVAGGERIFEATSARGVVVVPAEPNAEDCGCLDAGLDLELVDAGEDAELGTEDDQVRRLRRGRVGWAGERCGDAPALGPLPENVTVDRQDRCALVPRRTEVGMPYEPDVSPPDTDPYVPPIDDGGCSSGHSGGCGSGDACNGDSSGSSGCGGDSSAGSGSCGSDSGGCDGGGSGCDGGSGCSGDAASGAGSCGGDIASGSGSCGGDAGSCSGADCHAAGGPRRRRIPVHGGLQTMLLVGLALLVSRRWR